MIVGAIYREKEKGYLLEYLGYDGGYYNFKDLRDNPPKPIWFCYGLNPLIEGIIEKL
jgi:hypothetical protein